MSKIRGEVTTIGCRAARKQFAALIEQTETPLVASSRAALRADERAIIEYHLQNCTACAAEYRLLALSRATLDAAAAAEPVAPDEDFFRMLRARLARGESPAPVERADESWAAALLLTARQLVPAMAMLLLLIIGATLLWNSGAAVNKDRAPIASQVLRRDRIDLLDDPAPIAEDVLDTLVAIEEKKNGK
jgi:anti-sigma factor RsiW